MTTKIAGMLTLGFLIASAPAWAQGYGLYEQGTCAMGRAGAGVASPCRDGSAMFFNPAGLALDTSAMVSGEITGVAPRGNFTNSTTGLVSSLNDRTIPVPAVYGAMPIGHNMVAGIGVFAPYGLETDWPNTSEGRFLGYFSSIKSYYIQPTIAARLWQHVLIGGGVDITHTSLELRRRVDLSTQPIAGTPFTFAVLGVPRGTDFADVDLTGSGNHVGGHVGVIFEATDRVSVGARYLFQQQVSVTNGQLTTTQIPTNLRLPIPLPGLPAGTPIDAILQPAFAPGGPLSNQTASTDLPLPDQFVAGVAVTPVQNLSLFADYQWTHWNLFDTITITNQFAPATVLVESYQNTSGLRVGGEYTVGGVIVRAGFDVHNAGAPDQSVTPILPEAARQEVAAGVAIPLVSKLRLDLAYMFVNQSDRAGRSTDGGLAVPTSAVNNGTYHYYANLFSAGVTVHF
ncbi:MAG TPA: outer membrane protein transport protein [Vicinamibacterales bacterium]|nr:outer membrane protein transport protein [Vicinamibacterales bacterium]